MNLIQIDEFIKQLNLKIDDFKNGQDNLRNRKREYFDQNKNIKKNISEFFGVIFFIYLKYFSKLIGIKKQN